MEIIAYGKRIELVPILPLKKLKGFLKGMSTDIEGDDDRL
jgi:hypothetical protein